MFGWCLLLGVNSILAKKWFLLLVISFFALIGNFFRPFLFGYDSYASWACVVHGWCETLGWQELFVAFLEVMPPIMILAKIVMVLSLFFSLWACWKIIQLYFEERIAWISILFGLGLVPLIVFEFSKFENELFALPLVFWGLYFLLKREWVEGVGCFGSSLLFWVWPGYLLNLFGVGGGFILEKQLFVGMLPLFFGIFVLPLVFFVRNNLLRVFLLVFLVLSFGSGKFVVFLVPFCFIGIAQALQLLEEKQYNYNFLWVIAIIMFVGLQYALFVQQPSVNEMEIVKEAVDLSNDLNLPLQNDWSYGYWLWFYGYKTKNTPGSGWDMNYDVNNSVVLSMKDLSVVGCEPTSQGFSSLTRSMKVWKCN